MTVHLAKAWDWPSFWLRPRFSIWCLAPDARTGEPMRGEPEASSVVFEAALSDCEPCLRARTKALNAVRPLASEPAVGHLPSRENETP